MTHDFRPRPPVVDREQQLLAREVNERVHEIAPGWAPTCDYICECADSRCTTIVTLRRGEFARLRRMEDAFVLAQGHGPASRVLERHTGYVVARCAELEQGADQARAAHA